MSLAVKCPLTVPGTLAWLRWGIALTVEELQFLGQGGEREKE